MKVCSVCTEIKPLNEFHKQKQSKDGHNAACKVCATERVRIYRADNPRHYAKKKEWYQNNKHRYSKYDKDAALRKQVRELLRTNKPEEVAKQIGYTFNGLKDFCKRNKISIAQVRYKWTEEFIREVMTCGKTIKEQAKAYNLSFDSIKKMRAQARKLGIIPPIVKICPDVYASINKNDMSYRAEIKWKGDKFNLGTFKQEKRAAIASKLWLYWVNKGYSCWSIPRSPKTVVAVAPV